jgi:thymidylate synthase ThyX
VTRDPRPRGCYGAGWWNAATLRTAPAPSPAPRVRLVAAFAAPFDNAIATARTCYTSRVVTPEDVARDEAARALRDRIARSTYEAGHHTTLQHAHFQFTLENVSRQALWSFLHAHPFYNSEQVSQRYVAVKPGLVTLPEMPAPAAARFDACVARMHATYAELTAMLLPVAAECFFQVFPARRKAPDTWQGALKKKAQEVARYALPVATHAHLYHTVSGLTLHRYHRLCLTGDVPAETRLIVEAMVDEVQRIDPDFFRDIEDPIPLEDTVEAQALAALGDGDDLGRADRFVAEQDRALDGQLARLVDCSRDPSGAVARGVRSALGVTEAELSTADALARVLDPTLNPYLTNALTLSTMGKLPRALSHAHFTFLKKLSHTADSQDQRHRMVPGTRPVLARQVRLGTPRLRRARADRRGARRGPGGVPRGHGAHLGGHGGAAHRGARRSRRSCICSPTRSRSASRSRAISCTSTTSGPPACASRRRRRSGPPRWPRWRRCAGWRRSWRAGSCRRAASGIAPGCVRCARKATVIVA